jgi:EEF1A lysine methyltransferase 4
MPNYGELSYWNDLYSTNKRKDYDWYLTLDELRESLLKAMITGKDRADVKILIVGCGDSMLAQDLCKENYKNIINVDNSTVVIDKMKQKYADFQYKVDDVTKLSFDKGSFDVVIDKGCMDSIMCKNLELSKKMVSEVNRVLVDSGIFIEITYGTPETRMQYLESVDWKSIDTVELTNRIYLYKCVKKGSNENPTLTTETIKEVMFPFFTQAKVSPLLVNESQQIKKGKGEYNYFAQLIVVIIIILITLIIVYIYNTMNSSSSSVFSPTL